MSRYLLDTATLVDFSKRREPTRTRVLSAIQNGDTLGVCAVNVAEFYAGLLPAQRPVWDPFFASLVYWDITRVAAARAGQYRYQFARQGQPLSTADTLIAAVAFAEQATIVTTNSRDFPMGDVYVVSWR